MPLSLQRWTQIISSTIWQTLWMSAGACSPILRVPSNAAGYTSATGHLGTLQDFTERGAGTHFAKAVQWQSLRTWRQHVLSACFSPAAQCILLVVFTAN